MSDKTDWWKTWTKLCVVSDILHEVDLSTVAVDALLQQDIDAIKGLTAALDFVMLWIKHEHDRLEESKGEK